MRISKIEITGFKSFHARTMLSFREPVTAVVGPNGCGKSNIVDAIRWCMGEQSARHLRGKSMDDVIFNGSESVGAAGMAEVSLTFETGGSGGVDVAEAVRRGAAAANDMPPSPLAEGDSDGAGRIAATDAAEPNDEAAGEAAIDPFIASLHTYPEITVTRRLFRDGTSEYFINKTPCRLMDITNFFLGTGVGTKAYSIIEQGRIGLIVSSKPEDRRQIIEEAAGITKYKARRKAAERKMELTRQNLLRVSDVVGEIEKRLGSLRRQAQKADRYKRYKTELRDLDLTGLSHRYLGALAERRLLVESSAIQAERAASAGAELAAREQELTSRRRQAQEHERQASVLQELVYDLENRLQLTESSCAFSRREADELEQRSRAAEAEIATLREGATQTALDVERVREQERDAAGALSSREEELASREESYRLLRDDKVRSERAVEALRQELSGSEAKAARYEETQRNLARRTEDFALRVTRAAEEAAQSSERAEVFAAEAKQLEEKLGLLRQTKLSIAEQREQHAARLQELRSDAAQREAEVETLRTELHRRRSRLKALVEIQERYEGFRRGTRAIMQSRKGQGIRGLVADVVTAPPDIEPAIEALLGERLGDVIVESQAIGVDAIEYLKSEAKGRSTFIPLASSSLATTWPVESAPSLEEERANEPAARRAVGLTFEAGLAGSAGETGAFAAAGGEPFAAKRQRALAPGLRGELLEFVTCAPAYDGVAALLLGDVLLAEDLAAALAAHRGGETRTLVTVDGELIDPHGTITGGSRDKGASSVLQQKREIRELEEISGRLEADLATAHARYVGQKAEIAAIERLLESLTQDRHEGEKSILSHEKDLGRVRDEANRMVGLKRSREREREELEEARQDAVREAEAAATELLRLRTILEDGRGRLAALGEALAEMGERVEEAGQLLTATKVGLAQAREKSSGLGNERSRLEALGIEQAARAARLAEAIEQGTRRSIELRATVEGMAKELEALALERGARGSELQAAKERRDAENASLETTEVELRAARAGQARIAAELQALELRLRDVEALCRQLLEQASERYRLDLPAVCGDYHLRPLLGEAEESRLRELRELIERMGEVNLTAVEECAELEQRHGEITGQKEDLEAALLLLEKAISKINRTTRELFESTFQAVNENFQRVFPRLFNGGRARLELTDPTNLLESGVEIFAQPPGKKLGTVELFSGGEKALTAVALIFAIFLHKPSPFCLLDECDAPLDEANVGRYNDLIREMTDRTQFIVITHNKGTMQIADTLYGITMEEPGVSKLVSVNLTSAPARRAA